MSATFDATTKAAYDAATTAQSRAEAIVASLTGTISVKVFNGSNTEMGSGTMAAPVGDGGRRRGGARRGDEIHGRHHGHPGRGLVHPVPERRCLEVGARLVRAVWQRSGLHLVARRVDRAQIPAPSARRRSSARATRPRCSRWHRRRRALRPRAEPSSSPRPIPRASRGVLQPHDDARRHHDQRHGARDGHGCGGGHLGQYRRAGDRRHPDRERDVRGDGGEPGRESVGLVHGRVRVRPDHALHRAD